MMVIIGGILLPESFLDSEFFGVLAAFVAVNTLIFVGLAIGKMLPRVYWSDIRRRVVGDKRKAPRSVNASQPIPKPERNA